MSTDTKEPLSQEHEAILRDGKPTDAQKSILAICALNSMMGPRIQIVRNWNIGRWEIKFEWRSKKNLWGRFGGGWNWNFGFQAGGSTVLFNLLVASLKISHREKGKQ